MSVGRRVTRCFTDLPFPQFTRQLLLSCLKIDEIHVYEKGLLGWLSFRVKTDVRREVEEEGASREPTWLREGT